MNQDTLKGSNVLLGEAPDANVKNRPGVPMELEPPHPMGAAHWKEPDRQIDPGYVLTSPGIPLTPVFGTTVPPRGISGVIRRAAYRIPEHHTSHWLLLMFADRVDALEHNPRRLLPLLALPLFAGGLLLMKTRRDRRSWIRRLDAW